MYGYHLVEHVKNHGLLSNDVLHVVAVVSNPIRFRSRYRLFREFENRMLETAGVKFYIVEMAYGDRAYECTDSSNGNHLQLRTSQELWLKENMINLGVKRLFPKDWKYMAWVDADVEFQNPYWARETIQQLQHYPVVQPWSHCVDLGPHGEVLQTFESFCSVHRKRIPKQTHPSQPYKYAHSGYAWACTRFFWENAGGLMDFPILGSADHHMAFSLIGRVRDTVHGKMGEAFKRKCFEWEANACKVTQGDLIGYVKGMLKHFFHGKKADRKYRERWPILFENDFNPDTDLSYDSSGVLVLTKSKPRLIADIMDYQRGRSEDSVDAF